MRKYGVFLVAFCVFFLAKAQNSALHLSINGGKQLTNNQTVTLKIAGPHATHMKISNNESFTDASWITYATVKTWQLSAGDGVKTIYIKFKDKANNESKVISEQIKLDKTPPTEGKIRINKGKEITKNHFVYLEFSAKGAEQMMISNRNNFAGATWVPYAESHSKWPLAGADGMKTVYVKFKDKAGNISPATHSQIKYDKTPPRGTATIVGAPKWVNSRKVILELNCSDCEQMKISALSKEWIPYAKSKDIMLSEGDGHKVVYVKFVDKAHNVGTTIKLETNLKTTPPTEPKLSLAHGHKYVTNAKKQIDIRLHALGAKSMIISEFETFAGASWKPYVSAIPIYILKGEDGEKTLYAKFKDQANNETEVVSSKIILDRQAPIANSITINDGATVTNKIETKVKISATEAELMELSTVPTFSGAHWVKYKEELDYNLVGNDGIKKLYVRFKDKAGNVSKYKVAQIILDRAPPIGNTVKINAGAVWAKVPDVTLNITSRDAAEMMISENPSFEGATWEPFSTVKKFKLNGDDGVKTVGVKFKDKAGNISSAVAGKIKLSTKPPSECKIQINGENEFTTRKDRRVTLTIHAKHAAKMMISNSPNFVKGIWVPYTPKKPLWLLPAGDGDKKVYAKFISGAGNISEVVSDVIIQDLTPPTKSSITVNGGQSSTNVKDGKVKLEIKSTDAVEMKLSKSKTFEGATWEPFKPSKDWTLDGADGIKYIYAKFRDKAHNATPATATHIKLDRNPPTGSFVINKGVKVTTSRNVILTIKQSEALKMKISNTSSFGSEWMPITPTVRWSLTEGDGLKSIYIVFKDASGNESEVATGGIELDTEPPAQGTIVINENAEYCTDKLSKVKLAIKSEGAFKMKVSNRSDFKGSTWITYAEEKDWTLLPGQDERKVNIKFRDEAGNETTPVSDIIFVDYSPPTAGKIVIDKNKQFSKTKDRSCQLDIESANADEMMISNNADFSDGTWEPYSSTKNWTLTDGDGEKTVYIKFRDKAGNESTPVKDIIVSDTEF